MKSIPAGRVRLILAATLIISLIYYFIGSPRFYENNLGSFTEAGRFGFLAPSLYQFAVTLVLLFFVPLLMVTSLFRQKQFGLAMSRAPDTTLRIVTFGTMINTRPAAMPNGRIAIRPVLPQPTGICTIAGARFVAK